MPLDLSKYTHGKSTAPKLDLSKFTKSEPIHNEEVSDLRKYAAMAVRGASGFAPPGLIGAGFSAAGEIIGQKLEGEENINWPEVGVQAGLGAIPLGNTAKLTRAAIKGAGLSGTSAGLSQQTKKGLHVPSLDEVKDIGIATGVGGLFGAGAHKVAGKFKSKTPEVPKKSNGWDNYTLSADRVPVIDKAPIVADPSKLPPYVIAEPKVLLDDTVLKTEGGKVKEITPLVVRGKDGKFRSGKVTKVEEIKLGKPKKAGPEVDPGMVASSSNAEDVVRVRLPNARGNEIRGFSTKDIGVSNDSTGRLASAGVKPEVLASEPIVTIPTNVAAPIPANIGPQVELPGVKVPVDNPAISNDMAPGIINPTVVNPAIPATPIAPTVVDPTLPVTPVSGFQDNLNKFKEKIKPITTVTSEARQLQTSFDLSFPMRQGIANIHKKEFRNAFIPMLKAAFSEKNFKNIEAEINADPYADMFKKAGMQFTDPMSKDPAKMEEQLRGTFVAKYIPGIAASNRAYTTFANKLRLDLGKSMAQDAEKAGVALMEVDAKGNMLPTANIKAITKYINDSTGRGDLGKMEDNAVLLGDLFFSPKLIASRVNMFRRALDASNLALGGQGMMQGVHPAVAANLRKEAIKSMAALGSLAATSIGLTKMAGGKGNEDPRSTDFGKLKIGNTRFDFTGGFQQYVRFGAQFALGQSAVEGKVKDKKRADTLEKFLWAKASPMAGLVIDFLKEENVIGTKFEWTPELKSRMLPLLAQDIVSLWKEDPKIAPYATAASIFGVSVANYGGNKSGSSSGSGKPTMFKAPKLAKPN